MAPGSNRLLSLAAIVGSLTLLAVVIFMLWPPDPSDTAGLDQADGETVGWVSKVEANTIHVNSGPFGGGVVPLLVTKNTRITVGSKEGWFEDIRPGGQVKVVYQIAHGKRLARTVELLVDEGPRRPIRPEPRLKSVAGDAPAERVPTKALAGSPPAPEPRGARDATRKSAGRGRRAVGRPTGQAGPSRATRGAPRATRAGARPGHGAGAATRLVDRWPRNRSGRQGRPDAGGRAAAAGRPVDAGLGTRRGAAPRLRGR